MLLPMKSRLTNRSSRLDLRHPARLYVMPYGTNPCAVWWYMLYHGLPCTWGRNAANQLPHHTGWMQGCLMRLDPTKPLTSPFRWPQRVPRTLPAEGSLRPTIRQVSHPYHCFAFPFSRQQPVDLNQEPAGVPGNTEDWGFFAEPAITTPAATHPNPQPTQPAEHTTQSAAATTSPPPLGNMFRCRGRNIG